MITVCQVCGRIYNSQPRLVLERMEMCDGCAGAAAVAARAPDSHEQIKRREEFFAGKTPATGFGGPR